MIHGRVNSRKEAIIRLELRGSSGQKAETDAVIDTGFSGFMTLPPALIAALQLPRWGTSNYIVGDGTNVTFDLHVATVLWDGQDRTVFALATDAGALIGMSLLNGSRLSVDVKDGGAVTIEASP